MPQEKTLEISSDIVCRIAKSNGQFNVVIFTSRRARVTTLFCKFVSAPCSRDKKGGGEIGRFMSHCQMECGIAAIVLCIHIYAVLQ